MDNIYLVKFIVIFVIVTTSLMGLNVSMYSWRTKKFYVNYFLLFWCTAVIFTFTLVYISRLYNEIISEELGVKNAVKLYYYMNIMGVTMNYLAQLVNCKAIVDFFNQAQLFGTIKYFDTEVESIKSSLFLVALKTVIFPIIIEITLILRQQHDDVAESRKLLLPIYVLYPLVAANIIPNSLFGVFVLCRQLTLALNRQLSNLEKEANNLQIKDQVHLHKRFYRMQKFSTLADKLDELSEKYSTICSVELIYISLCSLPLVATLLCNLFGVTVGLFHQYYALADTLIKEESYDVFNATTNGIFLMISFLEIALHSLVGNQNIEATKETGFILKRIKLDNTGRRFRQAVEKFSFKLRVINFKIQPMKLFSIDLGLTHNVLSAVTSFLVILIQSDLTLRFSLK